MSVRTCEASSVSCSRPTASPSATLCQHHLDVLLASGRVQSIKDAEARMATSRGRRVIIAGLLNPEPGS